MIHIAGQQHLLLRTALPAPYPALTVAAVVAVTSAIVPSSPAALAAFRDFLEYVVAKYFRHKRDALATAIGTDIRSLRRTLNPHEGKHTLSLEHCLTLAKAIRRHHSVSHVLRQADKAALDDLIRELYGRPKLSAREEALLLAWQEVDGVTQENILTWTQQAADVARLKRIAPAATPTKSTARKPRTRGPKR